MYELVTSTLLSFDNFTIYFKRFGSSVAFKCAVLLVTLQVIYVWGNFST